jgi:hypothetical protein
MFRLLGSTIAALLLGTTLAATQPACLPKSVFMKNDNGEFPIIDLGYVHDVLTLCAHEKASDAHADKLLGCWTVNPTNGVLGESAARAIPGRGRRADLDAQNCINGYCIAPIPDEAERPFFATSTDEAHAAILTGERLYVFETGGKTKVAEIELRKDDAPDDTNVMNATAGLLYNGDTLFVIGADAGPWVAVWVFKQDGTRAGRVHARPADTGFNIVNGGYGILGRDRVAFADAGLQNMTTVSGANAATQGTKRIASYAPCTKDQFETWAWSEDIPPGACKRVLDAKFDPYTEISLAQLPSGDFVVALGGAARGDIAILSRTGLTQARRQALARCR